MAHSFNEIVQHHDHYIDEYNKIDKKKHLPLVNLSFFSYNFDKMSNFIATFEKGLFVTGKGPQCESWGKWADHRHPSKTLIVLYSDKASQCTMSQRFQNTMGCNIYECP